MPMIQQDNPHQEIRDAIRALCQQFPAEYFRKIDEARGYPEHFVDALTKAGGMAALIPEDRRGLGREAVALLLSWVEQQPGVRRSTAEVLVGNEASLRLLAGLGFVDDGTGVPPYVRLVRPVGGR